MKDLTYLAGGYLPGEAWCEWWVVILLVYTLWPLASLSL